MNEDKYKIYRLSELIKNIDNVLYFLIKDSLDEELDLEFRFDLRNRIREFERTKDSLVEMKIKYETKERS